MDRVESSRVGLNSQPGEPGESSEQVSGRAASEQAGGRQTSEEDDSSQARDEPRSCRKSFRSARFVGVVSDYSASALER